MSLQFLQLVARLLGFNATDLRGLALEALARLLADRVVARMMDRITGAAKELRSKKTPILTDAESVRRALYQLWKRALKTGGGAAADVCRDAFDQGVVPLVLPQLSAGQSLEDQLRIVARAQGDVLRKVRLP